MNSGLGLNFLRIVNEEGSNGWAQIYAKIPFDDVELKSKGGLLGAVFGENKEDWADTEVEMMTWIDEQMNSEDGVVDLASFFDKWRRKYEQISAVWIWVRLKEDNTREIKFVKWGEAGLILRRDKESIDIGKNIEEGRVLVGSAKNEDRIYLWTNGLGEVLATQVGDEEDENKRIQQWTKKLIDEEKAASGLSLKFEKMEDTNEEPVEVPEEETAGGEVMENDIRPVSDTKQVPPPEEKTPAQIADLQEDRDIYVTEKSVPEVVGNRYVGPLGVKEKILNWWQGRLGDGGRSIHIERKGSLKRKKLAGLVGVIFLLLLVISLVVGSIKMRKDNEEKKWRSFYEPIERSRIEALDLIKLNPVGAQKMMQDVKATYDAQKAAFVNGNHKNDLAELEKKINESLMITTGEKQSEINDVARIDLVRQGFIGDRLTITPEGKLLAMDTAMGVAVSVEVKTQDIRVVAGKSSNETWLDLNGEDRKTLILTKTGIKSAEKGNQVVSFDAAVTNPVALGRFGQNLYVLDQGNKEVFKYASSGDVYGERVRWLKQGVSISINPVDMAMDTDVWVVSSSGQVERFRRGAKEQFALSGLAQGAKISKIAVEVENGRIALLDSDTGTIAICSKESGNCAQQLKSSRLKQARDIEFGADGSLYVLLPGVVGKIN